MLPGMAKEATSRTLRDERVQIRMSSVLRSVLEAEAARDGRPLAALIRKVLVEHAAARVTDERRAAA